MAEPFSVSPAGHALTRPSSAPETITPERMELREAAQAFEAIFIRQMLASARATDFGGEGVFSGQGLEQFETMRDENLADRLSQERGGLGLARSIEEQLSAHLPQDQRPSTTQPYQGQE